MINFQMTKDDASLVHDVLDRYLYHLEVEIIHTDKRSFRDALKQREKSLKDIAGRLKALIGEESKS